MLLGEEFLLGLCDGVYLALCGVGVGVDQLEEIAEGRAVVDGCFLEVFCLDFEEKGEAEVLIGGGLYGLLYVLVIMEPVHHDGIGKENRVADIFVADVCDDVPDPVFFVGLEMVLEPDVDIAGVDVLVFHGVGESKELSVCSIGEHPVARGVEELLLFKGVGLFLEELDPIVPEPLL